MVIRKAAAMILREFVTQIQVWTEVKLELGIMRTTTRITDSDYFKHSCHDCQKTGETDMTPRWVIARARIQAEESDVPAVKSGRAIISLHRIKLSV
jgi:hypothetical protein